MEDLHYNIRGKVAHTLKETAKLECWEEFLNGQNPSKPVTWQLGKVGPLLIP